MSSDVYHVTFMWPESAEVAQRLERPDNQTEMTHQLQAYHREVQGLQDTYCNSLKIIDADQPHVDVFGQGENNLLLLSSLFPKCMLCLSGFYSFISLTETEEVISIA